MINKISVIIPIYNSSNMLAKCIESIIEQSYSNLEIILIDDGSTDNSLEVCNEYKKRDKRIVVISKKNGGVSEARNFGLKVATGDFISFIDSDDYIDKNFYCLMMEKAKEYNANIVICDFYHEDIDGKNLNKVYRRVPLKSITFDRNNYISKCYKYGSIDCFLCNKIYSRNLIYHDNKPIIFDQEIAMSEDALFNATIFDSNKNFKCYYLNKNLYHYVSYGSSASNKENNPKRLTFLNEKIKEIELLNRNDIDTNLQKTLYVIFYNNNIVDRKKCDDLINIKYEDYKKEIKIMRLPLRNIIKYYFSIRNLRRKGETI